MMIEVNGSKVVSKLAYASFCWTIQREYFMANLRLLNLGGCDIVLGVDWIKHMAPICFDFNRWK